MKGVSDLYNGVNDELKKHIQEIIDYHYNLNDKGHGLEHVKYVIDRSIKFASKIENINYNMVYVVAAYHDVAHHIDAKNHEVLSAQMLRADEQLKKFFSDEQIIIMSEAVEDHRSSLENEPRSIYGKIISSADRNTSVDTTLRRCYAYNKKHSPELNEENLIEKCRQFILSKYGTEGYARRKMYFDDEEYLKYLDDITELALNKEKFILKIKNNNK